MIKSYSRIFNIKNDTIFIMMMHITAIELRFYAIIENIKREKFEQLEFQI